MSEYSLILHCCVLNSPTLMQKSLIKLPRDYSELICEASQYELVYFVLTARLLIKTLNYFPNSDNHNKDIAENSLYYSKQLSTVFGRRKPCSR